MWGSRVAGVLRARGEQRVVRRTVRVVLSILGVRCEGLGGGGKRQEEKSEPDCRCFHSQHECESNE